MATAGEQLDTHHSTPGSLGELAVGVLRTQVEALQAHEPGTREGSDPEELHDMRVATRRLRAALKVFMEVLPPESEALRQEAGWLGSSLAAVRDLDVQLIQFQEWRATVLEPDRPGLDALLDVVAEQRVHAREELLAVLDSERYVQFVTSALNLLQVASLTDASGRVEIEGPRLIGRPYRRLCKLGETLDGQSPSADLHALRIRAKRLRYAVEFVIPVYGRVARRFVSRVVDLQDLLGKHQDAQVASDRLRAMACDHTANLPAEVVFVMGALAQRYSDEAADLRARFAATYRRATGQRWQKLQQVLKARRRSSRAATQTVAAETDSAEPA
jgi:CHAD domain-containing protein